MMHKMIEHTRIFIHKLHVLHDHYILKWETTVLGWHLPAPVGILIILLGIVLALGGVAMLVLPGQGILTIALGIAAIRIGTRVLGAERNAELTNESSQRTDVSESKEEKQLAQAHSAK